MLTGDFCACLVPMCNKQSGSPCLSVTPLRAVSTAKGSNTPCEAGGLTAVQPGEKHKGASAGGFQVASWRRQHFTETQKEGVGCKLWGSSWLHAEEACEAGGIWDKRYPGEESGGKVCPGCFRERQALWTVAGWCTLPSPGRGQ